MKKLLLMGCLVAAFSSKAQVTLFSEDFEFYDDFAIANVGDWTLTDVDALPTYGFTGITFPNTGVAKSFQVWNAAATTPAMTASASSDWTAHGGAHSMVCWAAVPPAVPAYNNDWLISPQVTLGASGNTLTFWAKSADTTYGLERFKVGISTTDTAVGSFTFISPAPFIQTLPNLTYVQYTYNLDAYANQPIYFAINCISQDQFGFHVDDFAITADQLSTQTFFSQNFAVYPNPATDVLNISSKNGAIKAVAITDINGRTVKTINGGEIAAQISIADLNSGVYFVKVSSDAGTGTTKIVKN